MTTDHGTFSGIKGVTRAKQAKSIDREIDKAVAHFAAVQHDRAAEAKTARKTARATEAARVRFTAADLATARIVQDGFGWYEVRKINKVTVSVVPTSANLLTEHVRIDAIKAWK